MLEKKVGFDHSITEAGYVQVRRITRVLENGQEISKSYHRHILNPGDDVESQDERSKAIAQAVWTPEIVAAHKAKIAESKIIKTE